MPEFELCKFCESETGRAGRSEDSLYIEIPNYDEVGPLCESCYNAFGVAMLACKKELEGSGQNSAELRQCGYCGQEYNINTCPVCNRTGDIPNSLPCG